MINQDGLALLRTFESCRLVSYRDSGGVPTIGFGHTRDVQIGQSCSQDQADAWLVQDVAIAEEAVQSCVTVPLNENERAACVVLTFNIGAGNFRSSSICRLLNEDARAGAARAFLLWDKARVAGKLVSLPGLQRRRAAEAHLFLTPAPVLAAIAGGSSPTAETIPAIAVPPEESGISTVERPPSPLGGKVTAGTAVAVASGAAKEAIDQIQPVHDQLLLLGLPPQWILGTLGVLLLASLAYVALHHLIASRQARA